MGTGQWSDQGLASKKRPVKNVGRHNMHHTILRLLATHTRGADVQTLLGKTQLWLLDGRRSPWCHTAGACGKAVLWNLLGISL